jgi:serine protease Do
MVMPRVSHPIRILYVLLGALLAVVLGGSFQLGRRSAAPPSASSQGPRWIFSHPAYAQTLATDGKGQSVAEVAERTLVGVVNISTTRKGQGTVESPYFSDPFFRDFFRHFGPDRPSPRQERSLGSGVIISTDGLVLTNNHVIADAATIKVVLSDKREVAAKVVGTDPKSDVAVLKLASARNLKPLHFGNSDQMRLGDLVLAVGNPFGVGQTVTMGIVSAKGRANMGIVDYEDFIQTDAAINPGNSGGALVNMKGELIGINTAILSRTGGYQGIGFAIPSNMVRPIMTSLVKTGKVVRGWLGIVIQEVDSDLADAMKLPTRSGVLISDVSPNGPAAKAGLRRGDLVVKLNNQPVDSVGALRNQVAIAGVGTKVKVDFYRDRKLHTVTASLGELPGNPALAARSPDRAPDGVGVAPLDRTARQRFNIPGRVNFGVVVTGVKPGSPAGQAGLQSGDVILEINRVTIDSVSRFQQTFSAARGRVLLLVYRRGSTLYMIFNK